MTIYQRTLGIASNTNIQNNLCWYLYVRFLEDIKPDQFFATATSIHWDKNRQSKTGGKAQVFLETYRYEISA